MNNRKILMQTGHRPFPLPGGTWIMKQIWHDLLFAHWPVREEEIAPLIPEGLHLDEWQGTPWVTISPFRITGLRIRGLPPLPFTSRFAEINVRTYVSNQGKPGIFFFSLDASNRLAVETARLFHLPYLKASMRQIRDGKHFRYDSKRTDARGKPAVFSGSYGAVDPEIFHAQPGTRLHWLTERYSLFTVKPDGGILTMDIHHLPWPLQRAYMTTEQNTMVESIGTNLPDDEPLATFTKRLDVLFWPMR